ncbi:MAG TPA: YcxB family protein [Candidatus Acidoferrales bacterium]|nr:YcxB family protein [Candidatus Acidoferrales bacterium]
MTLPLKLEYVCTEADMKEAQSLNLRQQLGGGSRWRALLALYAIFGGVLVLFYFQIKTEIAPQYRPYFLALAGAAFVFFFFKQRRRLKPPDKPTRLEVSEQGITILNDATRIDIHWSGFSQCLESPNLFVLLDRPKRFLITLPKRAFPDAAAQDWFRSQANQPSAVAASTADVPFTPKQSAAADGITLNYQLGYRDYVNRTVTSWRMRGIALAIYAAAIGMCLYQGMQPPTPERVNSPAKVMCIMLAVMTVMTLCFIPIISFFMWRRDTKYLTPRQLVLTDEHIVFAGPDGQGVLPWTTFTCYLENRWSFIVWNTRGQAWDMFPKRAFASAAELERTRELLKLRLRPSRWFII